MLTSIRAKLGAVFLGFLLLVAGSVVATFVTIHAQAADALVINLAGRQRMLTQKMSKAVLGVAGDRTADYRLELRQTASLFESTLTALLNGGSAPYGGDSVRLPAAKDEAVRAQLEAVAGLWDRFRENVETVQTVTSESTAFAQAVQDVEALSPIILQEMDRAVQLYETVAVAKLSRLRAIQSLFFLSAVALLIAGYLLMQRTIVNPLSALKEATQRMAGGDLESPIQAPSTASGEVRALARSFEGMRHELAASHLELERWTAELETRVEERTGQLAALFDVSAEISSRLEIERVLESVVEKTRYLAGGEVAVLCLLDPAGESLTMAATSASVEGLIAQPQAAIEGFRVSVGAVEAALRHDGCECPLLQPQFRRSHLAVPLRVGDRVLGILCVGHRQGSRFGEEQGRLLTLLANAGAIALENARSYDQAERSAALAERERILAEIHDGLAQTLSFLDLRLDVVQGLIEDQDLSGVPEHLALTRRTVQQAGQEVRRLMAGLQASVDLRCTFEELLAGAVEQFAAEHGMEVEVRVQTDEPIREPPRVYEQVVRVVLEALTNVHKHVEPKRAAFTLERCDHQVVVRIQDEGPGFDVSARPSEGLHFGLKVMNARAERIGGELSVESSPGCGTTVTLRWLPAEEQGGGRR